MMKTRAIARAAGFAFLAACATASAAPDARTDVEEAPAQVAALRERLESFVQALLRVELSREQKAIVQQAQAVRYDHARGYELHIALLQIIAADPVGR